MLLVISGFLAPLFALLVETLLPAAFVFSPTSSETLS
jgi:hypothetical protein